MILKLPQSLFHKVASTFIQPLLYGAEYVNGDKHLMVLDRSLRVACWGKARVAASWGAIQALGIPAHTCLAMGSRFQRLYATIWSSSMMESTRRRMVNLWSSQCPPRKGGLCSSFLSSLSDVELRLVEGGGLCQQRGNGLLEMHLNMPKCSWMHSARLLWKQWQLRQAHRKAPQAFPPLPHLVDWTLTQKPNGPRSPMLITIQTNGLNTRCRSHHHFSDECCDLCEYECGEQDDCEHRLVRCNGLRHVREEIGISEADAEYLMSLHPCHRRSAIWWLPLDYLPWRLLPQQAWQLWPSQPWLEQVNRQDDQSSPITLDFHYLELLQGAHPELRRHGAIVNFLGMNVEPLSAVSTKGSWPRRLWELDILMLASLLALRCGVSVRVMGLQNPLDSLWKSLRNLEGSNVHLVESCAICLWQCCYYFWPTATSG